ncbi:MAG: glycosyltransferase family 4 protein [Planctomycetota bacterium]
MKILIITQFFPPDITAAAFRLGDTATLLSQMGHEVKVLAGDPHKGTADGVKLDELVDPDVDVIRCHIKPLKKSGTLSYLNHYMSFVRSSISGGWRLKRARWKPDVILCSSPPLFVGMSGRFLARLFGKPLVFEVRDIWPDSAVAAGQLSEGGRAYKVGRWMEKHFYKKASHIVCVAKPMGEYIRSQCPPKKQPPVTVVYNGIRETLIPTPSLPPEKPDQPKTMMYAGNFGHVQDMELLVDGFIEAAREGMIEGWKLRLVGTGTRLEALSEIIAKHEAHDLVQIDPPVPRDVVFAEMLKADALYLSLQKSFVLEHTIPSKVFDYLAMCRPVVAALAGEGREILESTGANLCYDPGDREGLKQSLQRLGCEVDSLQQKAPANRELVLERFTRETAVRQLESVFQDVVGTAGK